MKDKANQNPVLTASQKRYATKLKNLKKAAHEAGQAFWAAHEACKHVVGKRASWAVCFVCGQDFGWWCPKSASGICSYHEGDENCRRCGQPDERK